MRSILLIAMTCALPSLVVAAPVASDSFETYTTGDLSGNNGGAGFTGAWSADGAVDVVNASLSYQAGTVLVNGGTKAAQVSHATSTGGLLDNTFSRPFTGQSGDVYFSFLFRPVVNGGPVEDEFFQFMLNDNTDFHNSGSIGMRNSNGTTGNDGYFARIHGASGANTNAEAGVLSVAGRTDLLVGKYSTDGPNGANYDTFDLWVNPTSDIETTPDATVTFNSLNNLLDFITLRVAALDTGDQYQIDALTIGTQFSDVVSTVPEPASIAGWSLVGLVAIAGGWLLRRRRRG